MFGQTSCQDKPELTLISHSAVIVESVCVYDISHSSVAETFEAS